MMINNGEIRQPKTLFRCPPSLLYILQRRTVHCMLLFSQRGVFLTAQNLGIMLQSVKLAHIRYQTIKHQRAGWLSVLF